MRILNPLGGICWNLAHWALFEILVGGLFRPICCSAICMQVIDWPQELQAWEMAPNIHHAASSGSSLALRFINIVRGMIGCGKWLPVAIMWLPMASLLPHRHSLPSILPWKMIGHGKPFLVAITQLPLTTLLPPQRFPPSILSGGCRSCQMPAPWPSV